MQKKTKKMTITQLNAPVFIVNSLEFWIEATEISGNVWWVVAQSAAIPSPSQIMEGLDHSGNPAVFAASYNVTSDPDEHNGAPPGALSPGTSYWLHAVQLLGDDVTLTNTVSAPFTTAA